MGPGVKTTSMNKARILVIEDYPDTQDLLRLLLERSGYEVLIAGDGLEGLEKARRFLPDLIILDLALPELDGWSAARQLKADPQTAGIPIVAVTAFTLPGDRREALAAGCDGYIGKPFRAATFASEIAAFLKPDMHAAPPAGDQE